MEISLIYYSSVGTIAYGTDKILPSSTVPTLYICIFRPYNKLYSNRSTLLYHKVYRHISLH